jgi:DUF4097 and DUF4098 domain-containing protein YvlB
MRGKITGIAFLLICVFAVMLSGCQVHISVGVNDNLTGEDYSNAEKYQTGAFTYNADDIKAVEVYWRSGEVEITESDDAKLHVKESGGELPEDTAMHYFLDDGVLRIRFCKSGAKIVVDAADKHLRLEVPKGIDLSVHTTAALVKADSLNQNNILIAALSGSTELGTVTADTIDLSSSSGSICADSLSAQSLKCSAASGSVNIGVVSVETLGCSTSSGNVTMDSVVSETANITTSSGSVDLTLAKVPSAEIHTSSGTVSLLLAGGGAEVLHTTNSGKLLTDRAYDRKGDLLYVFDEGASSITVETSSGNLKIQ